MTIPTRVLQPDARVAALDGAMIYWATQHETPEYAAARFAALYHREPTEVICVEEWIYIPLRLVEVAA